MTKTDFDITKFRLKNLDFIGVLERTGKKRKIRGTSFQIFLLPGVPSSKADMWIAQSFFDDERSGDKCWYWSCDRNEERDRHLIRKMTTRKEIAELKERELKIDLEAPGRLCLDFWKKEEDGSLTYSQFSYRALPITVDYDTSISKIIGYHWRKYFTHLRDQENVREFCDTWAATMLPKAKEEKMSLNQLNREASRALYRLSRDLGWRKLTRRESVHLGIDGQQWQHETKLASIYHATGAGEATLRAANGGSLDFGD